MKHVLITGKNSYIGEHLYSYLISKKYSVEIIETRGLSPTVSMFKGYDAVVNVAGIAHIKEKKANEQLYNSVNTELAIKIAKTAKKANVKQLVLLSTMSVYGKTTGTINKNTEPKPNSLYGKSKYKADIAIKKMEDNQFHFACIRPPMVYGKNCKGNYQSLRKIALKSPIFPNYKNKRSMIYIENLCYFIEQIIKKQSSGLFFPQNSEYVSTKNMVVNIAKNNNKKIHLTKLFNPIIRIIKFNTVKKVFGDLVYEKIDLVDYISFKESMRLTEGKTE